MCSLNIFSAQHKNKNQEHAFMMVKFQHKDNFTEVISTYTSSYIYLQSYSIAKTNILIKFKLRQTKTFNLRQTIMDINIQTY